MIAMMEARDRCGYCKTYCRDDIVGSNSDVLDSSTAVEFAVFLNLRLLLPRSRFVNRQLDAEFTILSSSFIL